MQLNYKYCSNVLQKCFNEKFDILYECQKNTYKATILYTTYSKRHHFCLKIFNNIETFLRSRRNI